MTLNTRIAVSQPVSLQELFMKCRELIGAESDSYQWEDTESWDKDGSRMLMMNPSQGLPGWLMIDYRPDGPLRIADGEKYEPEDEDETDPERIRPACAYEVSIDTAYGYNRNGESCTQLHCRFILSLAEWLEGRGATCRWQNEYSGSWHDPTDMAGFERFLGGGIQAMAWFQGTVKPAIENGFFR